jgi:hypothetical protein
MKRIYFHNSPNQLTEDLLRFTAQNLEVDEILTKGDHNSTPNSFIFLKIAAVFALILLTAISFKNANTEFSNFSSVNYFPVENENENFEVVLEVLVENHNKLAPKEVIKEKIEISEVIESNETVHITATETITLKPGFQVLPGATFQASITSSL